jgi:signal transduction histidine kinase/CheY-like chemotaxis protein
MQKTEAVDFSADIQVSPTPILVAFIAFGLIVYISAEGWADGPHLYAFAMFWLALFGVTALLAYLCHKQDRLGRWAIVVAAWGAIAAMVVALGLPQATILFVLPASIAGALISIPAAAGTALLETILLLAQIKITGNVSTPLIEMTLFALWAVVGIIFLIQNPVCQLAIWAHRVYEQAHQVLEEARSHQAELYQALDDLTHANQQMSRLNLLAQNLRAAAEEARMTKEQFVANVSHELRTPLNMIIGFSEMILQGPRAYNSRLPQALLADLSVIYRNAQHLSDLIDDVLDLSQLEAGQMALTKEYARIENLVEAATIAVKPLFQSKGLQLKIEIPPNLPPLMCDPVRIREVLLNLLSNAGRFTESGGVHIKVSQGNNEIIFTVADSGAGIAADDLHKLFQPFQQLDGSIRRRYGGSGLGLSISKRFVELHGGTIILESQPNVGTTFTFTIPVQLSEPSGSGFSRWLTPQWEFSQRIQSINMPLPESRPRLILIEHGDALRRLLERYFSQVDVKPVSTIFEAIQEISVNPAHLLLVNSPSVIETLEQINASTLPEGIPILACSVPEPLDAVMGLGASGYLLKPILREQLLSTLQQYPLPQKTILIVDDEPEIQRLFRRMLTTTDEEYHVLRANNGEEAIQVLSDSRPDLILLDLIMPNMDGFHFLSWKQKQPEIKDIPVILISAQDPSGHPIVSSGLAVVSRNGLSSYQLLSCIKAIGDILSPAGPAGGPKPPAAPPG